jgi:ribose transport system permease protein
MSRTGPRLLLAALNQAPLLLFAAVLLLFGSWSSKFLTWNNLVNILIQTSSTAIVGMGMTFVLLTAGVDLSVGAIMFVAAALAGKLLLAGSPLWLAVAVMLGAGLLYGAINATFVTRLGIMPFIVTLATLYFGRGLGLWITETRAMNLPTSVLDLGSTRPAGIPLPILLLGLVTAAAHLTLTRTPFGRQVYAIGQDLEAARKAGIRTRLVLAAVYAISGLCAGLGGMLSLAQLGAVGPEFGDKREFAAIAAAVLGGTSLFGGRGKVFPGTVLGAVLVQSIRNGLEVVNAEPYLYPLITSGIIFLAVLIDSTRNQLLARLSRRPIRVEHA